MIWLKHAILIPLEIVVEIMTLIMVPLGLLCTPKSADRMPSFFSWWDDYKYGVNGDPYWQGPDHSNGHYREYMWRLKWLFRNRINTFSHVVTGVDMSKCTQIRYTGDPATTNKPILHEGTFKVTATVDGEEIKCVYKVVRWSQKYCLRVYWGWKIKDWAEPGRYEEATKSRRYAQMVWYINPFCSAEG